MRATLFVETLLEGQFSLLGCWKLDDTASLVLSGAAPSVPGVYAFTMNGIAQYVGVASSSLAKRLYFYGRPGISQKTNIRLNASLREALAQGSRVDVYIATPPALQWYGWTVCGPEGLEAGIIKTYALPWNLRGASPLVDATAPSSVETTKVATPDSNLARASIASIPAEQLVPLRTAVGGKYHALCEFLRNCPQDKVSMTFAQIEQLVGSLPKSAMLHRAWWANHEGNTQAKGWMPARYLAEPDPAHRTVMFRRFSY